MSARMSVCVFVIFVFPVHSMCQTIYQLHWFWPHLNKIFFFQNVIETFILCLCSLCCTSLFYKCVL